MKSTRRSFLKKSALSLVAATAPLALKDLVNAQGVGSGWSSSLCRQPEDSVCTKRSVMVAWNNPEGFIWARWWECSCDQVVGANTQGIDPNTPRCTFICKDSNGDCVRDSKPYTTDVYSPIYDCDKHRPTYDDMCSCSYGGKDADCKYYGPCL